MYSQQFLGTFLGVRALDGVLPKHARILAPGMHVPVMAAVCRHERALSCALYRSAHGCKFAAAC
eukprot:1161736-Pelagomonas_calceolata.AAC.1